MWAGKVGKPTVLQGLCWKGEVGIAFLILRRLLQRLTMTVILAVRTALLPVRDLFVAWLEVSTGISRKLETQNHLYCCDILPQEGGILNTPGTSVSVALWGWGRGTWLNCTLAMHSGSLIRLQWAENIKLDKTDI